MNLTSASIAIFAELYWTPGILLQAEDRIHRIGQKARSVKIIYMLARGTEDDEMWNLAQSKLSVLESTIGEVEQRSDGKKGMVVGSRQQARDRNQTSLLSFISTQEPMGHRENQPPPHMNLPPTRGDVLDVFSVQGQAVKVGMKRDAEYVHEGTLSPVTKARIEENRRRALEKRAQTVQPCAVDGSSPSQAGSLDAENSQRHHQARRPPNLAAPTSLDAGVMSCVSSSAACPSLRCVEWSID